MPEVSRVHLTIQISKLETELRDARANVAKLRALSASGPSEAESTASAQARSDEMATMTKRSKEQDLEIEELKEKLKVICFPRLHFVRAH